MTTLHGHKHHDRQQRAARIMVGTGLARVAVWLTITAAFVLHIPLVVHWFSSVAFVSLLSILALALTDWGQVAASLAQLAAARGHQDAEHTRAVIAGSFDALDTDIARLAALQPGPEAQQLAAQIRASLTNPTQ